jgi:hypothetical protein
MLWHVWREQRPAALAEDAGPTAGEQEAREQEQEPPRKPPPQRPDPAAAKWEHEPPEGVFLSAKPPEGGYADPEGGARWEQERCDAAAELCKLDERGPVRCRLEYSDLDRDAKTGNSGLTIRLTNASDGPIDLWYQAYGLLAHVTFVLRDPDGWVVGTFCYSVLSSRAMDRPDGVVALEPGQSHDVSALLSIAAGRGYRKLKPGRYVLQAVFDYRDFNGYPVPGQRFVARSNRLPVLVR